jgi:CRISPR/Cas system-associated protein Cas10 (large subunit of type III CRISPR-Cas system)
MKICNVRAGFRYDREITLESPYKLNNGEYHCGWFMGDGDMYGKIFKSKLRNHRISKVLENDKL